MSELLRKILMLPDARSTYAAQVDHLHYFVILTTMFGAVLVGAIAAWFVVRFREGRRDGARRRSQRFYMPTKVEVGLVSLLVVLFFGWWWVGLQQYMRIRVPPQQATEIYVVAKQWMFKFSYPEGHTSVRTLYVPAGRPVRLIMTSRDVIHSFFVPQFRVKQDILPGRYTTTWFEVTEPGIYEIFCAEFCGTGHSQMRGQVVALTPAEYEAWLRTSADPREARHEVGERVAADRGCLRCHTTDGSPHIGPSFAGLYGQLVPLSDGAVVVADEAYLTESMMDPMKRVHAGFQPVMPSYKGLLTPSETAALVELIKALRDVDRWMSPSAQPTLVPPESYPSPDARGLPRYPEPGAQDRP